MKKRKKLCCVLTAVCLLTGCSFPDESQLQGAAEQIQRTARQIQSGMVLETEGTEEEKNGTVVEETRPDLNSSDYEEVRNALGLEEDNLKQVMAGQKDCYAYEYLPEEQHQLYAEILLILQGMGENVMVSTQDEKEIAEVFQCVMNDHPEIFYVSGYTYTKYTMGEAVRRITFSGSYIMDLEEREKRQPLIEQYVQNCLSGIGQEAGEYEKVRYIYEYLVKNTEYQLGAPDNQNICSVFLNGQSVCQGYAKAMQFLLNRMGVFCTLVVGTVENGEGHAWNLVQIDGAYYYVDPTWGDAYYELGESDYDYPKEKLPSINYDYLCVTTRQLEVTHHIDNIVPMPRCVSMEANYYVRENAYFTSYDREKVEKLFQKAYENGEELVTIKCSDGQVYEEVKRMLLDAREVFQYLHTEDGMVAYTDSLQQLSISFWL